MRLERTQRPPELQSEAWVAHQRSKVDAGIKAMATGLAEKPFCTGNYYTLADVAVGCTLGWISFRFPEIEWRETYPTLAKLLDKLSERQSFKDTVPK